MTVFHGTPCGGDRAGVAKFLTNRDALVPFLRSEDLGVSLEVCRSVILDNSAFSAWRSGKPIVDWSPYYEWVDSFRRHPRFAWAIVPDVIDGSEGDNDKLWGEWPLELNRVGVVVWHLHESLDRLERIVFCATNTTNRICLGSSGEFATPDTESWRRRMKEAMKVICDEQGRPRVHVHGLRMAASNIRKRYPFASVDSTNAVQNAGNVSRFGMYVPPTKWQRAAAIADKMEIERSPAVYDFADSEQQVFELSAT